MLEKGLTDENYYVYLHYVKMGNLKKHNKENPFVYGEIVVGENFIDRKNELKSLRRDLRDGEIVFLISPRRYGKTSLIFNLFGQLREEGIITAYIDLYRCASLNQFISQYLTHILQESETGIEKMVRFLKELSLSIRPKFSIETDGSVSVQPGISLKDSERSLEEILDIPGKISEKKNKKVVVALDEFQEIRNFNGKRIEKIMRSVIQQHRNTGYIFAGSKKSVIEDMINNKERAFYKSGKVMNLGEIDRKVFQSYVERRFSETGYSIKENAINEIFKVTGNSPYYVQYLCHEIWDSMISKRNIDKTDVQEVLKKIIAEEKPVYLTIWDDLTLHQRRLLQAIATEDSRSIYSMDFIERNELNAPSSVQTSVKLLIKKGILYREEEEYIIEDIFFKFWIIYFGT